MIAVDANIIFPLFVRTDQSDRVKELYSLDPIWRTEPFALTELINILATYERNGLLQEAEVLKSFRDASEQLSPNFLSISNETAIKTALHYKVTGYDARYLALAEQLGTPLVTEDKRLRKAAPALTISLQEALYHFPRQ